MKRFISGLLSVLLLAVLCGAPSADAAESDWPFALQEELQNCGCLLQEDTGDAATEGFAILQADDSAADLEAFGLSDYESFTRFYVLPLNDEGKPVFDGTYIGAFRFPDARTENNVYDRFYVELNEAYQIAGKAQNNPFMPCATANDYYSGNSWENDTEKMAIYMTDFQIVVINGNPKTVTWLQQSLRLDTGMELYS